MFKKRVGLQWNQFERFKHDVADFKNFDHNQYLKKIQRLWIHKKALTNNKHKYD